MKAGENTAKGAVVSALSFQHSRERPRCAVGILAIGDYVVILGIDSWIGSGKAGASWRVGAEVAVDDYKARVDLVSKVLNEDHGKVSPRTLLFFDEHKVLDLLHYVHGTPVDQWCALVAQPSELLLTVFKLLIGHVVELKQPGSRAFDAALQFIELQGDNSRLSVLSVLDQKDHQERDDRRTVLMNSCHVSEYLK